MGEQFEPNQYQDFIEKVMDKDDESLKQLYDAIKGSKNRVADTTKQFYDFAQQMLSDLEKRLDNPNLTDEERKNILERKMEILRMINDKDTENRAEEMETIRMAHEKDSEKRRFNWGIIAAIGTIITTGLTYAMHAQSMNAAREIENEKRMREIENEKKEKK